VVADGAYATKEVLKPAAVLGMTVVSRLRQDAAPRTLTGPRPADKRGPPRTYGPDVIDLAKRAGQRPSVYPTMLILIWIYILLLIVMGLRSGYSGTEVHHYRSGAAVAHGLIYSNLYYIIYKE
jgi:hypothetical protein